MNEINHLIRQDSKREIFLDCISNLSKSKGSILCVSGESGYGKTHLLKLFHDDCIKNNNLNCAYSECQAPIGNFQLGSMQPLLPFSKAIENLLMRKDLSPERKFAINVGMTMLTTIPLAGDLFYAIKELGKDWRQFKKEKSSLGFKKISSAAADYYDTIISYTEKTPLVIIFDDFHWADSQSVELLNIFAEKIESYPLLLIISFSQIYLESKSSPFLSFLDQYRENPEIMKLIELEPFTLSEIRDCVHDYFPQYLLNIRFENWIFEKTHGIPGIIAEYLKYFQRFSPFNEKGDLIEDFETSRYLPATVHSAFSQMLDKLDEDEKNILSLCSAEGRQFSALIVSQLLNSDILTAIKKLRTIQNKTNIIRSLGVKSIYGVKTTFYEFSQAFYHSYFESKLEFEEHNALHSQIADILKQKYSEAENDFIRRQLAPFIAAHSSVSGDNETTKSMLLVSAKMAQQYGSIDVVKDVYNNFLEIENIEGQSVNQVEKQQLHDFDLMMNNMQKLADVNFYNTENEQKSNYVDGTNNYIYGDAFQSSNMDGIGNNFSIHKYFEELRKNVLEYFDIEDYGKALNDTINFYEEYNSELTIIESAQLLSLILKAGIEHGDFSTSKKYIEKALALIHTNNEPIAENLILNIQAQLLFKEKKTGEAFELLRNTAQKALSLPNELKLLTIANIGNVLKENFPEKASRYFRAAKELSASLKFEDLKDYLENA